MSIFVHGELVEYEFLTSAGRLLVAAEVSIADRTLTLLDPLVFPYGKQKIELGIRTILELARQVGALAQLQGFERLSVAGHRTLGATPGRIGLSRYEDSFMILKPFKHEVSDAVVEKLWHSRADEEGFLSELRKLGAGKMECIIALRKAANISLGTAKDRVHFSKAWDDMRASDELFHEEILRGLEETVFVDVSAAPARRIA